MKHIFRTPGIPLFLIPCLVISPVWAQSVPAASDPNSQASNLELRVVEEPKAPGASFAPPNRLTVQVQDENGRPVSDAAVAFRLPDTRSSGTFADGAHSAVAYTDASGTAHVDGIRLDRKFRFGARAHHRDRRAIPMRACFSKKNCRMRPRQAPPRPFVLKKLRRDLPSR